jgi:E3 ubiquitin-protein ligase CHFR
LPWAFHKCNALPPPAIRARCATPGSSTQGTKRARTSTSRRNLYGHIDARTFSDWVPSSDLMHNIQLPTPREASPEPDINPSDFVRPCPNCIQGNPYGWTCPNPIVDPNVDPDNAWLVEDGTPPGHALCGNCENLLALPSPVTTKCDFCQISFCGIGVQGRCIASPILSQHPHGFSDVGDLIQSSSVYECFNSNTVEVDIMLDYLTTQRITPRHIYREVRRRFYVVPTVLTRLIQIVTHIQTQPGAFLPLIQLELFVDVHALPAGTDPDPDAPRSRICRQCAAEVFLYGLRDWFLRERQKGFLEESVLSRKDCQDGAECSRQRDLGRFRVLPMKSSSLTVLPIRAEHARQCRVDDFLPLHTC